LWGRGRIRQIFLEKKPLFGDKVLENKQLANFHNIDDEGISRLKHEIELRQQNNSRFLLKISADSMHNYHALTVIEKNIYCSLCLGL
jgi:hypothetical protein